MKGKLNHLGGLPVCLHAYESGEVKISLSLHVSLNTIPIFRGRNCNIPFIFTGRILLQPNLY